MAVLNQIYVSIPLLTALSKRGGIPNHVVALRRIDDPFPPKNWRIRTPLWPASVQIRRIITSVVLLPQSPFSFLGVHQGPEKVVIATAHSGQEGVLAARFHFCHQDCTQEMRPVLQRLRPEMASMNVSLRNRNNFKAFREPGAWSNHVSPDGALAINQIEVPLPARSLAPTSGPTIPPGVPAVRAIPLPRASMRDNGRSARYRSPRDRRRIPQGTATRP